MKDTDRQELLKKGAEIFRTLASDLNDVFPTRTEDTWKQICVALALREQKLKQITPKQQ